MIGFGRLAVIMGLAVATASATTELCSTEPAECCPPRDVRLSAKQMKTRLRHIIPVQPLALGKNVRIKGAVIFVVEIDAHGDALCIRLVETEPSRRTAQRSEPKPSVDARAKIHVGDFLPTAENCGVVHSARPSYPAAAKKAGIQGVVTVEFTISKSGEVKDVHALSGDPVFVPAAIAAAREYRFAPCRIPADSEPLEYKSQLQFSFNLNQ